MTTSAPPSLHMVSAWVDPEDPGVWSGTLAGLIGGLRSLGAYGGTYDVTPPPWVVAPVRRWLAGTGRLGDLWQLRLEMRAATALGNAVHRRRSRLVRGRFVLPPSALGRPVAGRYLTWGEISPSQLAAAYPTHTDSLGYPGMSPRGLASLVRQQQRVYRHAEACCVASSWAGASLVRDHGIDPGRVKVVGYGRNVEVELPAERDWSVPRFLFVGRSWARKNGDAVVRAFARLHERQPDAELHVVGEHPRIDVPGVVAHGPLNVADRRDRHALEGLFARATCFVMPSHIESFGIVYVEAAAAGLPSIGTRVGGGATAVGDGGILVDPADDDAILAAMTRLAAPDEACALGDKARAHAAAFTWRKVAERTVRAVDPGLADREGYADFLPSSPSQPRGAR